MNVPVVVLIIVFVLIAVRQVGKVRLDMWQVMAGGAGVVLLSGDISFSSALRAIDYDVMLFLFGMFVVGQALEESGYLSHISYQYFKRAKSVDALLLWILFGAGIASAFLMNDTLAIIGTPVVLLLARKHEMSPQLLLLSLAFAVTIGSTMSPIGNPQNLLIALRSSLPDPFVSFLAWLFIPTMVNLLVAFAVLKRFYRTDFHDAELSHSQEPIRNHDLALLARISLNIIIVLVAVKILLVVLAPSYDFRLTFIALVAALPILVGSPLRWKVLRRMDWPTLAFFAAMFILMEAVWQTGTLQHLLGIYDIRLTSVPMILGVSIVLSQFISNVPLVALIQPMVQLSGGELSHMMALAAGSTIAGNLFILGAASNVIIIQNAERKARQTITFRQFARVGVPLTIANATVYWLWIEFLRYTLALR